MASIIVSVIEEPVAERYATPELEATARTYYEDVGAFEAAMPVFGKPRA